MLCFSGFELYSRWVPLLNFSRGLDFPYICLQFFPGNFSRQEETCIFTDKCIEHFIKVVLAHVAASNTLNFFQ